MAKTIHNPAYRELVARLRDYREASGASQSELARALGWPQQRLSAVEAGARRLDVLEFLQLTRALGRSPADLIGPVTAALEEQARCCAGAGARTEGG